MNVASRIGRIGSWVAVAVLLAGGSAALGQWQIQPITAVPLDGSSGAFYATPAVTFDSQNRPHVAFQPVGSSYVLHAYGNALGVPSVWTMPPTTVMAGVVGQPGIVHLATAGSLVYLSGTPYSSWGGVCASATFDGNGWHTYVVPGFSNVMAALCGMATDGAGQVNWIFNNWPGGSSSSSDYNLLRQTGPSSATSIKIAKACNAIWLEYPIPSDILRLDGDLTFDSSGNLHTVQYYENASFGTLLYAKGPTSGPFVVDDNVDMAWWAKTGRPAIAVDGLDQPHIVYTTLWPYYRLNYLTRTTTGWRRETIDGGGTRTGYVGTFPKVLIGLQGAVHVIYADGLHAQLKHARQTWSSWQIEVIDTVGTQTTYSAQVGAMAAAMDSVGGIGVVYWDGDDGMLKYAYLAP